MKQSSTTAFWLMCVVWQIEESFHVFDEELRRFSTARVVAQQQLILAGLRHLVSSVGVLKRRYPQLLDTPPYQGNLWPPEYSAIMVIAFASGAIPRTACDQSNGAKELTTPTGGLERAKGL